MGKSKGKGKGPKDAAGEPAAAPSAAKPVSDPAAEAEPPAPVGSSGVEPAAVPVRRAGKVGIFRYAYHWVSTLVFTPIGAYKQSWMVGLVLLGAILVAEVVLCLKIIEKVAYTEIDWKAYMQEVEGFLAGERDYSNIRGDTGPCVYPAGFLYVFTLLRRLTESGENIKLGQMLFMHLYLMTLSAVLLIYKKSRKVAPIAMVLLVLSKRIHSIYVLRMFNDCVAMFLMYLSVTLFCAREWRVGCVLYSFAVSVKMNILLFAPGLLLLLLEANSLFETIVCLVICASVQLLLGLPFLITHPLAYIKGSFDLGRVFMFKWTVNFKFLPEEVFVSKPLALALLGLTVSAYAYFFVFKWRRDNHTRRESVTKYVTMAKRRALQTGAKDFTKYVLSPDYITTTLFVSNFIGVVFARSLHYQFYCWYFHQLPFLLCHTNLPWVVRLAFMGAVEWCFNVYPATPVSSAVLQAMHLLLLVSLALAPVPNPFMAVKVKLIRREVASTTNKIKRKTEQIRGSTSGAANNADDKATEKEVGPAHVDPAAVARVKKEDKED